MSKTANEIHNEYIQVFSPKMNQVGGDHYKNMRIQPVQYIYENNIPYIEGCVIKYVTRWRDKNGIEDLEKAKHFLEILIDMEKHHA